MRLPNSENAYLPSSKLNDYLLSTTHPVGRSKARFFPIAGFDETNADLLEQGLIAIAQSEDVEEVITTPHGTKYTIDGSLGTPTGTVVEVRTIWIIETNADRPRFITAYPA